MEKVILVSKLVGGMKPLKPLTCRAYHIECSNGNLLIIWNMMEQEVMVNLEQPTQGIITGEEKDLNFR